jgi:hypothetical protein
MKNLLLLLFTLTIASCGGDKSASIKSIIATPESPVIGPPVDVYNVTYTDPANRAVLMTDSSTNEYLYDLTTDITMSIATNASKGYGHFTFNGNIYVLNSGNLYRLDFATGSRVAVLDLTDNLLTYQVYSDHIILTSSAGGITTGHKFNPDETTDVIYSSTDLPSRLCYSGTETYAITNNEVVRGSDSAVLDFEASGRIYGGSCEVDGILYVEEYEDPITYDYTATIKHLRYSDESITIISSLDPQGNEIIMGNSFSGKKVIGMPLSSGYTTDYILDLEDMSFIDIASETSSNGDSYDVGELRGEILISSFNDVTDVVLFYNTETDTKRAVEFSSFGDLFIYQSVRIGNTIKVTAQHLNDVVVIEYDIALNTATQEMVGNYVLLDFDNTFDVYLDADTNTLIKSDGTTNTTIYNSSGLNARMLEW